MVAGRDEEPQSLARHLARGQEAGRLVGIVRLTGAEPETGRWYDMYLMSMLEGELRGG